MAEGQSAAAEDSADIVAKLKFRMMDHALPLWSKQGWDTKAGGFVDRLDQDGRDGVPFRLEGSRCRGAPRLPVPITGVAEIALDAMKIGVDPRAIAVLMRHDDLMRAVPVVLRCPPQRLQ